MAVRFRLCPPGHPLRFLTGVEPIYPYKRLGSIGSLRKAIRSARPDLIVPCDDGVVWQLHDLYASEGDLQPLIDLSLGTSEAHPTVRGRAEVLHVAEELCIPVPRTRTVNSEEDLNEWSFDAPAVLKQDGTWRGEGISIVRSREEAVRLFRSMFGAARVGFAWKRFLIDHHPVALWSWLNRKPARVIIQEFIVGRQATTMFACWRREFLAGVTAEVLVSKGARGPSTAVRLLENNEIENAARLLTHKLKLSGFHGLDFILEEGNLSARMIELNPRATQLAHLNLSPHGDLAGVLASKLRNRFAQPVAAESRIQENVIAFFPATFKLNPTSVYLSTGYHDVPWEEPALVQELLATRGLTDGC
jgi:predicted ATP-grasp superfamily ATP-dependent carboligase